MSPPPQAGAFARAPRRRSDRLSRKLDGDRLAEQCDRYDQAVRAFLLHNHADTSLERAVDDLYGIARRKVHQRSEGKYAIRDRD